MSDKEDPTGSAANAIFQANAGPMQAELVRIKNSYNTWAANMFNPPNNWNYQWAGNVKTVFPSEKGSCDDWASYIWLNMNAAYSWATPPAKYWMWVGIRAEESMGVVHKGVLLVPKPEYDENGIASSMWSEYILKMGVVLDPWLEGPINNAGGTAIGAKTYNFREWLHDKCGTALFTEMGPWDNGTPPN